MNEHQSAVLSIKDDASPAGSTGLALQGVQVQGRLDGLLLRTTIQQRYRNTSGRLVEPSIPSRWLTERACWACR